ncbi:unnamed protein product [Ambrosiozyma monospora]|uniref:Unnamed protein product n=1 Tax=Ambrosiozyma monospora TaxID=43982 RepID=A0ACB5SRE1_AMBMO|nr:unnamed protein product [Ambrosiozyma monospora]
MNFFSIAATTLFMISSAFAETIQLDVRSDNVQLSGAGVVAYEEGGSNIYLFAVHGDYNSTDFEFNGETLSVPDEDYTWNVSNSVGVLGLTTDPSTGFTFTEDGVLQLNGDSESFYACYNSTEDPHHRSANFGTFQLFYDHTPTDTACAKVELIKELQTSVSAPPVSA